MFLNTRKFSALALLVLAIAALGAGLAWKRPRDLAVDVFQERTNRVELPTASGSIRTVELYPDKLTRKHGVEENADGTTNNYWYRPDGTLDHANTLGVPDAAGNRREVRRTQMERDGVTFKSDLSFYKDGTSKSEIVLRDDKTTTRRYFHQSGELAKDQVMSLVNKVWYVTHEDAFYEDGAKQRVFRVEPGVSETDTLYAQNERVTAIKVQDLKAGTYKETWYYEDGTSPMREVWQDYSGTVITAKRKDGSVSVKTLFQYGNIVNAYITVQVFDRQGQKRLEQGFSKYEGTDRLRSVEVYRDGKKKELLMLYGGGGPEAGGVEFHIIFDGDGFSGPRVRREYRKDGSLAVERREGGSIPLSAVMFTEEQNIRHAALDPDIVKNRIPTELPPQKIQFIPED